MMTGRNLHELGLMNGTLLRLLDEVTGGSGQDDAALLLSTDEREFRCRRRRSAEPAARLRLLGAPRPGHRAAGGGDRRPPRQAGAFFLRREMLYTAITRASSRP
jgi:exodeoxyribonuclease V alpha subunit